jgi:hypothetical protein
MLVGAGPRARPGVVRDALVAYKKLAKAQKKQGTSSKLSLAEKAISAVKNRLEAAANVDLAAGAALAVVDRATLAGTLTGQKTAFAGTLDKTLTMVLHTINPLKNGR